METILRSRLEQRHEQLLSLLVNAKEMVGSCQGGLGVPLFDLSRTIRMLKFAIQALEKDSLGFIEKCPELSAESSSKYLQDQLEAEQVLIELESIMEFAQQQESTDIQPQVSTKLPKLELVKFNGDILKWTEFWDKFEETIHSQNLKDVVKLSYLLSMLEGDARQAVEGITMTNDNYQVAIHILKSRYGSRERVVDAHYTSLKNLKKANNNASDCRQTLDNIEKHLRVLQSLGEDIHNSHLRITINEKFPEPILYQVNLLNTDSHSVQSLRTALEKVIVATERSNMQASPRTSESNGFPGKGSTTEALHIGEFKQKTKEGFKRRAQPEATAGIKRRRLECVFCKNNHYSDTCRTFPVLVQRKKRLVGKCFRCFCAGHIARQCQRYKKCVYCKGPHNRALCPAKFATGEHSKKEFKKPTLEATTGDNLKSIEPDEVKLQSLSSNETLSCLQTATARIICNGEESPCRLLLDCGSQRSYLTKQMANKLSLNLDQEDYLMIYTFGSEKPKKTLSPSTELMLITKRHISKRIRVNVVPHITGEIPVVPIVDHIVDVVADDDALGEGIDLLIGNDYYFSFLTNEKIKIGENLFLVNTDFGWITSGRNVETNNKDELSVITYSQSDEIGHPYFTEPDLPLRDTDMKFLWALESIGIVDSSKTTREEEAVGYFNETTKFRDGRYEVKWPWTQHPPDLPTNYGLAYGRLKGLLRRLDQETLDEYNMILKEQLEAHVIEVIEPQTVPIYQVTPPIHYLPHHIVRQEGKRGRIVYDASAKIKDQKSLNECMYRGPSMLEDSMALLLKFRTGRIGILADVEKAFLQVSLQEVDRDVTRFLWMKDPTKELSNDNLLHLRFCRVPFGVIASPFLLTATIRYHMARTDQELLKQIADKFYVDNLVTVADSTGKAGQLYLKTREVFEELSMNVRDWSSNDKEFLDKIPEVYQSKAKKSTKVLGLNWNLEDDTMQLRLNEKTLDPRHVGNTRNKRDVLRTLASFYDPCGFAAPLVLPAKILLQDLWKKKIKWDSPLDTETLKSWKSIVHNLRMAKDIRLPRYIGFSSPDGGCDYELHSFTDASKNAYAAVVYLRATNGQKTKTTILMSKSRVTPLKDQDNLKIPRLELLGFLIGSRLLSYVSNALGINIKTQYLWSDSLIVLSWMKSDKLLPPFVQRRIDEIKLNKNTKFRYVDTKSNPADLATRPEQWHRKRDFWINGPQFLSQKEEFWPSVKDNTESTFCTVGVILDNEDCQGLSSAEEMDWQEEVTDDEGAINLDDNELNKGDDEIIDIRKLQSENFPEETLGRETHLSRNLGLYLDVDKILRCGGRLGNTTWSYDKKHPVLIPKDCEFTNKVIQNAHETNYHVGVSHTLSIVRQKYWIPQGRSQVQKVLKRCERCIKHGGGPFKLPPAPMLPAERVNYSAPFTYTGVDYFGPLYVGTTNGKEKRWVCLFTCLAVRAVHMEIVKDLTAQECLLAFRRFTSCRGLPITVISDNATQFTLTAEVLSDPFFTERNIKWKFIPQLAPWHGGFYERMVGLVKHCLKRTLEKHLLSDSQLATVMKEIEAVVNSRPLTCVSSEPESVLRPCDFLTLGRCIATEPSDQSTDRDMTATKHELIEGWVRGHRILEEMKRMFTSQYLPSLRERYQQSHKQPRVKTCKSPQIGDVVQLKGDSKNRDNWKVGKITSLIRGSDGECRVAKVKVDNTEFIRSIGHLYPLEIETENEVQVTVGSETEHFEEPRNTLNICEDPPLVEDVDTVEVDPIREQIPVNQPEHVEQNEVPMSEKPQESTSEEPLVTHESRVKRAAAIQARQKIAEWTSQLAVLL